MSVFDDFIRESTQVESEQGGILGQMVVFEGLLILEEQTVHLPEFALLAGRFGRLGSGLGVRMDTGEWKMAKDETELVSDLPPQLLKHRVGAAAMGTLEVTVLDQGHRSGRRPQPVIALAEGRCERGGGGRCRHAVTDFAGKDSSARRMPSAPGLTPMGET
jgi:hypothetical protein